MLSSRIAFQPKLGALALVCAVVLVTASLTAAPTETPGPATRPFPGSEALDDLIREHRTGPRRLALQLPNGAPLPADVAVRISQTRHEFLFGCLTNGWGLCPDERAEAEFRRRFAEVFNYSTVLFHWGKSLSQPRDYEASDGQTDEAQRKAMIAWCRRNNIAVKGHTLVFFFQPAWVAELPAEKREELLWRRVTREPKTFAGDVTLWEAINEPTRLKRAPEFGAKAIQDVLQKYGELKLIEMVHERAGKADPNAKLILNETFPSRAFFDLARRSIEAGVRIDGIGMQMHGLTGYVTPQRMWEYCEEYKALGKPLHFTELMMPSCDDKGRGKLTYTMQKNKAFPTTPEGEARQAKELVEVYRTLFAHPSSAAITWWGMSDFLGCCDAPVGLLRADMTPKPAYEALHKLVKQTWWTTAEGKTAGAGRADFTGFYGDYRIECAHAGQRLVATFTHARGKAGDLDVVLQKAD